MLLSCCTGCYFCEQTKTLPRLGSAIFERQTTFIQVEPEHCPRASTPDERRESVSTRQAEKQESEQAQESGCTRLVLL